MSRGPLVFHSNFYFPKRHRLVEELLAKRAYLKETFGLEPSGETVHIFLFEDEEKFRHFLRQKHPSFPDRRAFFLQSETNLIVYAYWNARVAEDLRHEVTHAYVHSVVPEVPLWLDEGIAEYFEVPIGLNGLNSDHADYLMAEYNAGRWRPNLSKLESLSDPGQMSQTDYAESWLWVHYLVHNACETHDLLQSYLQQCQYDRLNKNLTLMPQLVRVDTDCSDNLVQHLKSLAAIKLELVNGVAQQ